MKVYKDTRGTHDLEVQIERLKIRVKDLVDPREAELDPTKKNMSSLNDCVFTISNLSGSTFELTGLDTTDYNEYGSGGNVFFMDADISNLHNLEGRKVEIKVDGEIHPGEKTVSGGSVTLDFKGAETVVGLPYESFIQTLNKEYSIGLGSMQAQRTSYPCPVLRVHKSKIPLLNDDMLPDRIPPDEMDKKTGLHSGDLFYGPQEWNDTGILEIKSVGPFPLILSGIFGTAEGGSR